MCIRLRRYHHGQAYDLDSSTLTWEYNLGSIRIYTEGMREKQGAADGEGAGGLELVEGEEDEDEGEDEGVDAAEHGGRGYGGR